MVGRSGVVRIDAEGGRGTGFFLRGGGFVTALHVVARIDDEEPVWFGSVALRFMADGVVLDTERLDEIEKLVVAHDVAEDWVVLDLRPPTGVQAWDVVRAEHVGVAWFTYGFSRDGGVGTGGVIRAIDAPVSVIVNAEHGTVAAIQLYSDEAAAGRGQPVPGFSGAPVVVAGKVIGLLRQAPHDDEGVAVGGMLFACPIQQVMARLGHDLFKAGKPPEYVFVAHASADKLLVMRLCRDLLARGIRPWLDIWDLAPGHDWEARLRNTLTKAPAVIVCEGPHGSGLQQREYDKVLRDRIQAPDGLVLWVRLPGAPSISASEPEGLDVIELDEANWSAGVDSLAARIGIDRTRSGWRSLEAEWADLSETELSPYRGLSPFRERDARWMFGRDEEVASLLALAGKQALLTVIGASGSGKSSLVMAGLCAALRNGALDGERITAIGYLRPGKTPCEELARALVSLSPVDDPVTRAMTVAKLRDHLRDPNSTDMLKLVVRETVPNLDDRPTRKLLLVVDQLEELFTEARLGQHGESPEAIPFVRNIIEATKGDDAPLWIVTTLRADFLPHCLDIAELARTLNSGTYLALPPMREEQLREAVELPALRVGFDVEPKLMEKLVAGAAEQAGRLPLLQHVLRELWERRDDRARSLPFSVYADTGGLEGAIAAAAERALSSLREQLGERALAVTRRVMTRLVHIGEGTQGDTRRRVNLDELGRDDETRRVLDVFVGDARVLVSDESGGAEVIEIAHEALLREWRTLVGWLDADRDALRLRQDLARDAAKHAAARDSEYLWRRGRIDEARRVLRASSVEVNEKERAFLETSHRVELARLIRIWAAVAATFVVLLGLVAFAFNLAAENKRQAQKNAELAESEKAARILSDEGIASQKGLRASMLFAGTGSYIDAAILAIEAGGAFGPTDVPPSPVFEGLLAVLAAEPVFEVAALEGHSSVVTAIAFSPDGSRLATASDDKTARLWDVASGKPLATLKGHSSALTAIAFSPDGSRLATASDDETARLWEVASGKPLASLEGHSSALKALAFSPDGSRLATASLDTTARLWDVASGKPLASLEGHSDFVNALAFSPDGSRLATASRDSTACLWDVASGKPLASLEGHSDFVNALAFSPDGSRLATTSLDKTVRLWDVASGKPVAFLEGHSFYVNVLAFSPDGSRLATASDDNTARLWPTTPSLAVELICRQIQNATRYREVADICDPLVK